MWPSHRVELIQGAVQRSLCNEVGSGTETNREGLQGKAASAPPKAEWCWRDILTRERHNESRDVSIDR